MKFLFYTCFVIPILFLTLSCERNLNPFNPEQVNGNYPPPEGEIAMVFSFYDLDFNVVHYDTLVVKEFENAILIDNAIIVDFPAFQNLTISFFGDFEGTDDQVVICYQQPYDDPEPLGRTHLLEVIDLFNRWFCTFLPLWGHETGVQEIKFYIFIIDTDNNNTGKGKVTFTNESLTKTVWIDASKNTVDIHDKAASSYFQFPQPITEVERSNKFITPPATNKDILYLFPYNDSDLGPIHTVHSAYGSSASSGRDFLNGMVYAFFPVFNVK